MSNINVENEKNISVNITNKSKNVYLEKGRRFFILYKKNEYPSICL